MHPHMVLPIEEVVELTTLKEKCTAVIPSGPAPINCLLWSVFSLLLRSRPHGLLEHFVVCLNGPDKRTGNPKLQDDKEKFLKELQRLKWYHSSSPDVKKDMPISIIRVTSRVGHAEAAEMAIGWIHTDTYLMLHDDVIITDRQWTKEVLNKFYANPNAVLGYASPELLFAHCDHCISHGLFLIRLPNMHTHFLMVRKSLQRKIGASWLNYHLGSYQNPIQFELAEEVGNMENFKQFYMDRGIWDEPQSQEMYNFVHMGVGSWFWYKAAAAGLDMVSLNSDIVEHLGGMSFYHDEVSINERINNKIDYIQDLENEIMAHPDYSKLYMKYKTE